MNNYSRVDRALRIISYILRLFYNTHPVHRSNRHCYNDTIISAYEIKRTKLHLAIVSQQHHYADEYKCLLDKKPLNSKSCLISLNSFLDKDGVMRLNGRLVKSPSLSYTENILLFYLILADVTGFYSWLK